VSRLAVFVNFEWIENAIPPLGEVKDRHVEYEHRVVQLPVALEYFSPFARETSLLSFHPCFSFSQQLPAI
jgi:hypothetical protein